jgi:hypothetical protein
MSGIPDLKPIQLRLTKGDQNSSENIKEDQVFGSNTAKPCEFVRGSFNF